MRNENRYLKRGKWSDSRVCKILDNEIYIGTFMFGKYNRKNEMIKNEITELEAKKKELNYEEPLDIKIELIDSFNNTNLNNYLMNKELPIYQKWLKLDPETKKLILHKFIRQIEISRDEEYFIDITNIKFEKQYFNKNADEFLNDLMLSFREDYKGFEYRQIRDMDALLTLYENYNSISVEDYLNNNHNIHEKHKDIINNLVANQGVLVGAIILDNKFIDEVLFIPKMP